MGHRFHFHRRTTIFWIRQIIKNYFQNICPPRSKYQISKYLRVTLCTVIHSWLSFELMLIEADKLFSLSIPSYFSHSADLSSTYLPVDSLSANQSMLNWRRRQRHSSSWLSFRFTLKKASAAMWRWWERDSVYPSTHLLSWLNILSERRKIWWRRKNVSAFKNEWWLSFSKISHSAFCLSSNCHPAQNAAE